MRGIQRSSSKGHMAKEYSNTTGSNNLDLSKSHSESFTHEPHVDSSNGLRLVKLTLQKFASSFSHYSDTVTLKMKTDAQL
jgi:hypothetical protein